MNMTDARKTKENFFLYELPTLFLQTQPLKGDTRGCTRTQIS